jgi:CheY-like chemotaxis protein
MATHVLVVDDEATVRRLVQLNLERAGYRVSTANDGVEALERVAADRPDLILSDITMPRLDGIELVRRLKGDPETEAIPVVMLTAKAQDEDHFEAERSGADRYLHKPFHPLGLLEMIRDTLSAAQG